MRELELLSVVALLEDVADHGLLRGQVGTVVDRLAPGVYEVEFSDDAKTPRRQEHIAAWNRGPSYRSIPKRPANGSSFS